MPEKKKTTVSKGTERRMTNSQPSKTKGADTTRSTTPARATSTQPVSAAKQLATFEAAMRHFHKRQFQEGRSLFQQATVGPQRDIAQRATLHAAMCERRLQEAGESPLTAEEHYTYGIALVNTRNLPAAQEHLEKALSLAPDSDHIHYAMALAKGLSGDVQGAYQHLARAIDLEPRNRLAARQDADFASFAGQPPLDSLLYPEKRGW